MNRRQLVEFGIIAVAIIILFKVVEALLSMIITAFYSFQFSPSGGKELIITNLVLTILYLLVFFIFVKKKDVIAEFIDPASGVTSNEHSKPIIGVNLQESIYAVLIVVAVISLIASLGSIINYLVNYFMDSVKQGFQESDEVYGDFKGNFIRIILASLIIIFSRPLSEFFAKRNTQTPEFEFEKDDQ